MKTVRNSTQKNGPNSQRLNEREELIQPWRKTRSFGWLLITLLLFVNQAFCQDEANSRLKDLSGTYFIESESQIVGNIKRRLQVEEDRINGNESIVSIVSDGQEVFSGRRHGSSLEASGTWSYVHSSQDSKHNGLQADRNCTIAFGPEGEDFTITMRSIKIRPKGGLFANMLVAIDQGSKGVDGDTVANNMQWEIAFEKNGTDTIKYMRRKHVD